MLYLVSNPRERSSNWDRLHSSVFWSILLFVLAAGSIAWGQAEPIAGLPITLTGETGLGLAGASGSGGPGSSSLYWSTAATLDGYYHDPRFLKFNVSPLYVYDRDAEGVNLFHNDNEGLIANVNFLNSSNMPISFSYALTWNGSTAIVSGPTPINSESSGFAHNWTLSWSYRRGIHWPTFSVSYSSGASNSMLASGEGGEISYLHHNLQLTSTYNLLGFRFFGNFNLFHAEETAPDLLALGVTGNDKSDQKVFNAGGDRALPWIKGNTDFRFTRTETTGTLLGGGATQTFDNAGATVNSTPTPHLVLNASANYNSNGLAQAISGLLVNGNTGVATPFSTTVFTPLGSSRVATGSATYTVGHGFSVFGVVGQEKDNIAGAEDVTAFTTAAGMAYSHKLFGGNFSATYNMGRTDVKAMLDETDATGSLFLQQLGNDVLTQSATANYFHGVGRWNMQGSFRFVDTGLSQSGISATGITKSVGAVLAASTRLRNAWNFSLGGNYAHNDVSPAGANADVSEGVTASIANRTLSVTGQWQRSSGYSALCAGASGILCPISATGAQLIPSYSSVSDGESVAVTWSRRRLVLNGNYTRSSLNLSNPNLNNLNLNQFTSQSGNNFWYVQAQYRYRKLTMRAEFRHWTQFISTNQSLNLSQNGWIFEVLRPFRIF